MVALTAASSLRNTQGISPRAGACGADSLDEGSYLPHPDCTLYYQCEHGLPHIRSCPDGLYFNAVYNVCDWPDLSGCIANDAPEQDDARPVPPVDEEEENDNDGPAYQVPGFYTSCPAPGYRYTVSLPHPSCSLFYKCVHGIAWESRCPDGLVWNVAYTSCDWPSSANCVENAAPPQPDAVPL